MEWVKLEEKMNKQEVTFESYVAFNVFLHWVTVKAGIAHEEEICITNLQQVA